jgi:hypothetical protein
MSTRNARPVLLICGSFSGTMVFLFFLLLVFPFNDSLLANEPELTSGSDGDEDAIYAEEPLEDGNQDPTGLNGLDRGKPLDRPSHDVLRGLMYGVDAFVGWEPPEPPEIPIDVSSGELRVLMEAGWDMETYGCMKIDCTAQRRPILGESGFTCLARSKLILTE